MSFTINRLGLRRKLLLGSTIFGLIGFLAIGSASCVSLEQIATENQCGNSVLEPDNGEACDQEIESCGAAGTPGACRFLCGYGEDNDGTCPTGLGCGLDFICRKSAGLSESAITIAGGGTTKLLSGDFDGDGRDDVVAVGLSTADVHFLTTEGLVERTVTLPNEKGIPGIGDVDGDGLSDIVLALDRSMGVLLGQEDRTFVVDSSPTMFSMPNTRALIPLGTYTKDNLILAFHDDPQNNTTIDFLKLTDLYGHNINVSGGGTFVGSLQGAVATMGLTQGTTSCGVAAFELTAKGPLPARLVIGTRCGEATINSKEVPFVGGSPWGGAFFVDVDNDKNPDVIYGVEDGLGSLKIIKDVVGGVLPPPIDFPLGYEASDCQKDTASLGSAPLAIGDINGDSYPDLVDAQGVILYNPNSSKMFTRHCLDYVWKDPANPTAPGVGWTNAVIGDFNGDGTKDVLAARKNQGVLDFWSWQPGGFNTVPIFVGGPVEELVMGDLDGDTIADAVFRFISPNPGNPGPMPLYALFGNPLGLPSQPQLIGMLRGMERLAIGRVIGSNGAGDPDILSDVVVLSSPDSIPGPVTNGPNEPTMPLSFIQGNATRSLVSPLMLQPDTPHDIGNSDSVYGIYVGRFGIGACDAERMVAGESRTPSNIVALGDGTIWLAGCKANGSSVPITQNLAIFDGSFLFAPVDSDPDSPSTTEERLACFATTPTNMMMTTDPDNPPPLGLGEIVYSNGTFQSLPADLSPIDNNTRLPTSTYQDAPYAFADVDDNGTRDVILTAYDNGVRTVFIFWNGTDTYSAGTLDTEAASAFPFDPPPLLNPHGNMPGDMQDSGEIMDVVAINLDGDRFKELAVLTQDHVYLLKLALQDPAAEKPELAPDRSLQWFSQNGQPFANVRGGQALLAIDADSDGIEDLLIADTGKLLLYFGTERL